MFKILINFRNNFNFKDFEKNIYIFDIFYQSSADNHLKYSYNYYLVYIFPGYSFILGCYFIVGVYDKGAFEIEYS